MLILTGFGTFWYIILFALAWILLFRLISKKQNTTSEVEPIKRRKVTAPNLSNKPLIPPKPTENLSDILKKLSVGEISWPEFSLEYEKRNPRFVQNFRSLDINHTPNAIKHSICIRMNLSLKETAAILNVSVSSVKNARNRLKKQLDLGPTDSIQKFIHKL